MAKKKRIKMHTISIPVGDRGLKDAHLADELTKLRNEGARIIHMESLATFCENNNSQIIYNVLVEWDE
jgi:hypothetical protein